jgi:serine/threonine-protein kinase
MGETLGEYKLLECIGTGGAGAVYRAFHARLNRDVAVKVLPSPIDNDQLVKRFEREAKIISQLQHPHIISVFDFGVANDYHYLVMPLLKGGSLDDLISDPQKRFMEPLAVVEILLALGKALDFAHMNGIIHRDVKPSNVMFDGDGNVYLADFGTARLTEATSKLTETGTTLGTPAFMAPEQWSGNQAVGATDQYALGIMAYQLISGRSPFQADTILHLMQQHMGDFPPPVHEVREELPKDLALVINVALAKHPEDRYPSVTAFAKTFAYVVKRGHLSRHRIKLPTPLVGQAVPTDEPDVSVDGEWVTVVQFNY